MNVNLRNIVGVNSCDLHHILNALCACETELGQLERNEVWFSSDSLEGVASSKQILKVALDIEDTTEEEENEIKQASPELHFD